MKHKIIYVVLLVCFLSLLSTAGRNRKNCLADSSGTQLKTECPASNPKANEKDNDIDLMSPLHFFVLSI